MTLKSTIGFTALILVVGSFTVQAAYPIWHDTTATAVVFNKTTCFIGTLHKGFNNMYPNKSTTSYWYIHLRQPINIFPISPTGDLWDAYPVGHQYDFGLDFVTTKVMSYTRKHMGRNVRVLGQIFSLVHGRNSPLHYDMQILNIKVFRSSADYESGKTVCQAKPVVRHHFTR